MREMGLEAIYPKPKTTLGAPLYYVYPYLLRGLRIDRPNQIWSTDITYIPMRKGFLYLVAVLDWYSRYVLSWVLSNSLEKSFCLEALEKALTQGCKEIVNTDQGSQFTSAEYTGRLLKAGIQIRMDGRGRALDNIFVERLWRSVKYEEGYLKDYQTGPEAIRGLGQYLKFYNEGRPYQSLDYRTPKQVHYGA